MSLNIELVVQPLFFVGDFGDLHCIGCPFVSGPYVTMFYNKCFKQTQYVLSVLEISGLISFRNYCSSEIFFRIIYAQTFFMFYLSVKMRRTHPLFKLTIATVAQTPKLWSFRIASRTFSMLLTLTNIAWTTWSVIIFHTFPAFRK
jgi:hypothetical protein